MTTNDNSSYNTTLTDLLTYTQYAVRTRPRTWTDVDWETCTLLDSWGKYHCLQCLWLFEHVARICEVRSLRRMTSLTSRHSRDLDVKRHHKDRNNVMIIMMMMMSTGVVVAVLMLIVILPCRRRGRLMEVVESDLRMWVWLRSSENSFQQNKDAYNFYLAWTYDCKNHVIMWSLLCSPVDDMLCGNGNANIMCTHESLIMNRISCGVRCGVMDLWTVQIT